MVIYRTKISATELEFMETEKLKKSRRLKANIERAKLWLDDTHTFKLCRVNASVSLGGEIKMTGREAKERNARLEEKFKRQLDAGHENAHLWKWTWIDAPENRRILGASGNKVRYYGMSPAIRDPSDR